MNDSSNTQDIARQATSRPRPAANNDLRLVTIDHSNVVAEGGVQDVENRAFGKSSEKNTLVTWMSLPHKRQLIILTLARLSEPLVQTSLQVCLGAAQVQVTSHPSPHLADGLGFAGIYVLSAQVFR